MPFHSCGSNGYLLMPFVSGRETGVQDLLTWERPYSRSVLEPRLSDSSPATFSVTQHLKFFFLLFYNINRVI
jgi:hypothetical protein